MLRKDVPDLVAALGRAIDDKQVDVVAVKGRANYLCLRRWFPWERQASLEPDEARLKAKILAWLPRTETGDRAELRLTGGEEAFWRQISEERAPATLGRACSTNAGSVSSSGRGGRPRARIWWSSTTRCC